jgi:hypothetical protein
MTDEDADRAIDAVVQAWAERTMAEVRAHGYVDVEGEIKRHDDGLTVVIEAKAPQVMEHAHYTFHVPSCPVDDS